VEVYLRDGRRLEAFGEVARGSDRNFASEDAIVAKFEKLAAATLSGRQRDHVRNLVLNVEELRDLRELGSALCPH
jgi:2-methylcitrate dehydratase PrpD